MTEPTDAVVSAGSVAPTTKAISEDEARAGIWWSIITEPGDELAGYLRESFGLIQGIELLRHASVADLMLRLQNQNVLQAGVDRFGPLEKLLQDGLERYRPRFVTAELDQAIRRLESSPTWIITRSHPLWPEQFDDLGWAAPAMLWGVGERPAIELTKRSISIVGSRGASNYGQWVTTELVSELVAKGFCIVSGGAYGIDGIAHRAALNASGRTVAVMAGGIDRLYPSGHGELFEQMCLNGAVISELSPGRSPTKWRFLQRNRLIAALGLATVVVEAGARSGSINTVNHALALDRPVGAVPGAITSTASVGANRLIAQGLAQLITSANDIAELVGETSSNTLFDSDEFLGPLEKRMLDALTKRPAPIERLAMQAGMTKHECALALAQLSLLGLARGADDGYRKT